MLKKFFKLKDNDNNNILHIMISDNKCDKIKKLLEKGLKYGYLDYIINKQNKEGDTPLHLAVKNKNYSIASLLIDYGANKNIMNCQGQKITMNGGGTKTFIGKRYL